LWELLLICFNTPLFLFVVDEWFFTGVTNGLIPVVVIATVLRLALCLLLIFSLAILSYTWIDLVFSELEKDGERRVVETRELLLENLIGVTGGVVTSVCTIAICSAFCST
jgi:hypothetical protein